MKNLSLFLSLMFLTGTVYCQNLDQEIAGGRACDTLFWTSTEYPVRLMNNITELQQNLSDVLTLYPEDFEKSGQLTYRFTITCAGINIESHLFSSEGLQTGGISTRILTILNEICIWSPAIHGEKPVNSFYNLTIDFQKGKITVVPQNTNENIRNDKIEVIFNQSLTFDDLVHIRQDLAEIKISLEFTKLEFDENGGLVRIGFKVDCNDGFSGSLEASNLTRQSRFGFFRDYSKESVVPFGTGHLK